MDKAEREQRFDGLLFSLAEQHPQGVLDVSFKSLKLLLNLDSHSLWTMSFHSFLKQSLASSLARPISSLAATMESGKR